MVIGDELPTMPGQAQVVLGPDPKLIFICSCVYNFAHSLLFLFHHYWDRGGGVNRGRENPGGKAEGAYQVPRAHVAPAPRPRAMEVGGECQAGAKGSLETTKNWSWQPWGWKTHRKEEKSSRRGGNAGPRMEANLCHVLCGLRQVP